MVVNTLCLTKVGYMKRNLKSKKINTLIADFLESSQSRKPMNFRDLWRQVVGVKINSKTNSIKFKDHTLFININDSIIKSKLSSQKSDILEKINDINSNIKQIIII